MKLKNINYLKWMKLSVGVPFAMLLAGAFGLNFAMSAGTIAILTVQDTKKETLAISIKRIIAFLIMTTICMVVFPLLGYHVWAYAAFLCPFVFVCMGFKLDGAISMNAVLASHYLSSGNMGFAAVGNEAAIFCIGAGIGMAVNLIMPENLKKIREEQSKIDESMRKILNRMSFYICQEDKSEYTADCFIQLEELLFKMEKEAKLRIQNTFTKGDTYFISYMQMRMKQCEILKGIYTSIRELTTVPLQTKALSEFLEEVSSSLDEKNNVEQLSIYLQEMRSTYKISELPKNREEFENRSILMEITRDLGRFLQIKREFVDNLTSQEQEKYWLK